MMAVRLFVRGIPGANYAVRFLHWLAFSAIYFRSIFP